MLLTRDQIVQINDASLRLLAQTGIKVAVPRVQELLLKAGCTPGIDADVVRIPEPLVAEMVELAPTSFDLWAVDGSHAPVGPGAQPMFWTGNALHIMDDAGFRPLTEPDFVAWTRVTDHLENVFAAVAPTISEYPPWSRDFVGFRLLAENTRKHLRPCIYTPDGALAILEMAPVLLGGVAFRERPITSFGYTIISPLHWSQPALDLFIKSSGHGAPMMINAEPTAGSTSPVTLAGTLALANAEALSGVVILQLLEPGRPVVFNLGFAHTLDMRRAITRTGAPENGLLGMAGAQLAAFHGLPSASWASTESMIADAQAAAEFGLVALLNALGGVNIIWGVGQLESQRTVSPEQGVICDDIAGAVLRAWRGIGVDAETIAEDVITSIGHSADYLGHDHTLDHFRDELLMPALGFCGRREEWQNAGSQTQTDRARARVREILSLPAPEYLSEDQSAELLSIQESWMKQLAR